MLTYDESNVVPLNFHQGCKIYKPKITNEERQIDKEMEGMMIETSVGIFVFLVTSIFSTSQTTRGFSDEVLVSLEKNSIAQIESYAKSLWCAEDSAHFV